MVMRRFLTRSKRPSLWIALVVPLLVFALACGAAEEPTATPTTAPDKAAPTATTAPAAAAPTATPVPAADDAGPVATPTPTAVPVAKPAVEEEEIQRGGKLFIPTSYFPESYDAHIAGSNTTAMAEYAGKVYTNLFINTGPSALESYAECEICKPGDGGWVISDGGKTWTINMIEGIKFSTGQEMTSADVKYSLQKIMGQIDGVAAPRVGSIKEFIDSVETPDKYTVVIKLLRPSDFVAKALGMSHGGNIFPDGTTRDDLKSTLVTSGPWNMVKEVKGTSWKLEANKDYFKKGMPYLDEVELVRVMDATSRHAAFLTHKTPYTFQDSLQFQPQLQKMVEDGKIYHKLQKAYCGPWGEYMNVTKPPFDDIKMRQAMNLTMDRVEIGSVMFPGLPVNQALLYFTSDYFWGQPDEEVWNVIPGWGTGAKKVQEIEDAKQMIKDAGYPDGIDVKFMVRTAGPVRAYHDLVRQVLTNVGMRTEYDIVDGPTQIDRMLKLEYQFQHYVFCVPTKHPDDMVGTYWVTGASRNTVGYSNTDVDALFVKMSSELDPAKKRDLFHEIRDTIVVKDQAYAPLANKDGNHWFWKDYMGVVYGPDVNWHASSHFHRSETTWFKK